MGDFEGPSFHTRAGRRTSTSPASASPSSARAARASSWSRSSPSWPGTSTSSSGRPQWLFDHHGYLAPYPPQVNWLDRNLPLHTNFMRFRTNWLLGPYLSGPLREIDPDFDDPHARSAVNKRLRDERIAFIERKLAEPAGPDREDDPAAPAVLGAAGAGRPRLLPTTTRSCATTSRSSPTGSTAITADRDPDGRRHRARGRRDRLRHRLQGERVPLADGGARPRRPSGRATCGPRTARGPTSARCCPGSRTSS